MKWHQNEFWISDERVDVDLTAVHRLLSTTYWANSRPKERTEQGLAHSVCFSVHQENGGQVGFARVITDGGCYAIVVDVVISPDFQRKGLGRWLISMIREYPDFAGTVLILWTTDEVEFYKACGFNHEESFHVLRQAPHWMKTNHTVASGLKW